MLVCFRRAERAEEDTLIDTIIWEGSYTSISIFGVALACQSGFLLLVRAERDSAPRCASDGTHSELRGDSEVLLRRITQ